MVGWGGGEKKLRVSFTPLFVTACMRGDGVASVRHCWWRGDLKSGPETKQESCQPWLPAKALKGERSFYPTSAIVHPTRLAGRSRHVTSCHVLSHPVTPRHVRSCAGPGIIRTADIGRHCP